MDTSHSSLGGGEDVPANQDDDWQREAEAVEVKEDDLCEFYQAALEGSKYDSADLQEVHLFASKSQATLDPRSAVVLLSGRSRLYLMVHVFFRSVKVKAVMREMKQLEESLPVHPDSAIFLRQVNFTNTHKGHVCIEDTL